MEKYLLSIFSGVYIRQVIFRENMYDLLVGQVKLSHYIRLSKEYGLYCTAITLIKLLLFLYYYMRNFCNLIGLEQWYFSLIWNHLYLHVKITKPLQVVKNKINNSMICTWYLA